MWHSFNFWDRLQAKVITPYFDNNWWKTVTKSPSIICEKFNTNPSNIARYYPNLESQNLTQAGYSFVEDNFSSYRFRAKNVILDPDFGWVIMSAREIFKYSFPYTEDPWDHKKRRPNTFNYLKRSRKGKAIPVAASIRFGWQNYYHFFIDGLTQVKALDEFDPEGRIPLIVPENYLLNRFVADYFENVYQNKRQIITQSKNQYFLIEELYLFKEEILSDSLIKVVNQFDQYRKLSNHRKIFINRNYLAGRYISNLNELIPILEKYGFETIESTDLSLLEQVELFSTASHIIGIHGAGLVNSIFKKDGNLKVLEIAPSEEFQPEHYKNICKKFDFDYQFILGEGKDSQNMFTLDVAEFEKTLKNF